MTESAFAAFFGAIGENIDFLAFAGLYNLCGNFCAFNIGCAYLEAFAAENKNLIKSYYFAFVGFEFFNVNSIVSFNTLLFAAGFDYCVHGIPSFL